jgi:hypothetical protein
LLIAGVNEIGSTSESNVAKINAAKINAAWTFSFQARIWRQLCVVQIVSRCAHREESRPLRIGALLRLVTQTHPEESFA